MCTKLVWLVSKASLCSRFNARTFYTWQVCICHVSLNNYVLARQQCVAFRPLSHKSVGMMTSNRLSQLTSLYANPIAKNYTKIIMHAQLGTPKYIMMSMQVYTRWHWVYWPQVVQWQTSHWLERHSQLPSPPHSSWWLSLEHGILPTDQWYHNIMLRALWCT